MLRTLPRQGQLGKTIPHQPAAAPSAGETMVLRIRQPAGGRGETIGVVVHRGDFGDVPDIFVSEAVLT
jgi:hypothetical protein